jgi:hypothetical protein
MKITFFFLLLFNGTVTLCPAQSTILFRNFVFDYFRQTHDSTVYVVGGRFLMHGDSLSFRRNEYQIDSTSEYLNILFKNKLLYSYSMSNGKIEGTGYCFYPFIGSVAIQGNFIDSKLHGLVFIQRQNGSMVEVMEFNMGEYVKHVYHWLCDNKKCLKYKSKNRSSNPLTNN